MRMQETIWDKAERKCWRNEIKMGNNFWWTYRLRGQLHIRFALFEVSMQFHKLAVVYGIFCHEVKPKKKEEALKCSCNILFSQRKELDYDILFFSLF